MKDALRSRIGYLEAEHKLLTDREERMKAALQTVQIERNEIGIKLGTYKACLQVEEEYGTPLQDVVEAMKTVSAFTAADLALDTVADPKKAGVM